MTRAGRPGRRPTTVPPGRAVDRHPVVAGLSVEAGHDLGTTDAGAGSAVAAPIVDAMIAAAPGPVRKAVMGATPVVTASPPELASAMTVGAAASRPRARVYPNPASRRR